MNWEHIKAEWSDAKGKVKSKWGKLTDDDLAMIDGKWDQLVARLHERYGYAKDDAEREVDSFLKKLDVPRRDDGEIRQHPRH